ncbi:hypothetical protein HY628_03040, partial [Candidatus Uhrbacteria bacterium]|nr:hypothetical protein [Candidatus Uhrbacteria bacterium]
MHTILWKDNLQKKVIQNGIVGIFAIIFVFGSAVRTALAAPPAPTNVAATGISTTQI